MFTMALKAMYVWMGPRNISNKYNCFPKLMYSRNLPSAFAIQKEISLLLIPLNTSVSQPEICSSGARLKKLFVILHYNPQISSISSHKSL